MARELCRGLHLLREVFILPDPGDEGFFLRYSLIPPLVKVQKVRQRQTRQPAGGFEFRFAEKMTDISQAQIGDRYDIFRDPQSLADGFLLDDAHPADPEIFRPRGQPQVLYSADGTVEIHDPQMSPANYHRTGPGAVAGDRK